MLSRATLSLKEFTRRRQAAARRREIEEGFPDFLRFTAACARAGLSIRQALEESAKRTGGPIGRELKTAAGELRAGVPAGDVLEGLAKRLGTSDAAAFANVLSASIKYGGDTAAALDRLGAVAVRRGLMRGEVNALTAQARFSAVILSVLPAGFFAAFPAPAKAIMSFRGVAAITAGLVLNISGFLVLRYMSNPERLL